jgi:uncharacterized protein DUF2332
MAQASLSFVATKFSRYAEQDYRGSSELYQLLSGFVAKSPELLQIASHGNPATPNLFFGAVHYLLMNCKTDPLAQYYPSLYKPTKLDNGIFSLFQSFCIRRFRRARVIAHQSAVEHKI